MRLFEFLKNSLVFLVVDNGPVTLICVLGLVAIYLLLPRPQRMPVLLGAACAGLAVLLTGWLVIRIGVLNVETFLFYLFAAGAVISGGLLITQRNPARAALSFALVVLSSSGLFLLQAAPFLMAATIIVYAGAIIVTFLFVLMLAQPQGPSDADARSREPFLAAITGFLLLGTLLYVLKLSYKPDLDRWVARSDEYLQKIKDYHERIEKNENAPNEEEVKALAGDLEKFRSDFFNWWHRGDGTKPYPSGGKALYDDLLNAQDSTPWKDGDTPAAYLARVQEPFQTIYQQGVDTRNNPLLGNLQPVPEKPASAVALSEMSGPRPTHPLDQLRRDEWGRPKLPAENTTYLGRSLFSDYLLPVELAGMLLLVATIGAIAIANRRPGERTT